MSNPNDYNRNGCYEFLRGLGLLCIGVVILALVVFAVIQLAGVM